MMDNVRSNKKKEMIKICIFMCADFERFLLIFSLINFIFLNIFPTLDPSTICAHFLDT